MKRRIGPRRLLGVLVVGLASILLAPAVALATPSTFTQIAVVDGGPGPLVPIVRGVNGTLHLTV